MSEFCDQCHDEVEDIHSSDGRIELCEDCADDYYTCEICEYLVHSDDIRATDGRIAYCEDCFYECCSQCDNCNEYSDNDDILNFDNINLCSSCYEDSYYRCYECNDAVHEEDVRHVNDCTYCADCGPSLSRSVDCLVKFGTARNGGPTFGVEVEVEFEDSCPFELGEYHSKYPASNNFFGGWRGEEDGSLSDGAEFISPAFDDASGLAEIIATFATLKAYDARVPGSCGQHVTVDAGSYSGQIEAQRLAMVLEEALFALTGSFRRLSGVRYCQRIKAHHSTEIQGKQGARSRTLACGLKRDNLVEFRHPPGTLNAAQVCINVGIARFIADTNLPEDELDKMVEVSLELQSIPDQPNRIHAQVLLGLRFLASHGWCPNGAMEGLPYEPSEPPTIQLRDYERGHRETVTLPHGDGLKLRMWRQLERFYKRMGEDFRLQTNEYLTMAQEAVNALDPVETYSDPNQMVLNHV